MIRSFNGKSPKIASSALISEVAYVIGDVEIGENSSVWPGAIIRGDVARIKIGDNSHLEDNCVVHTGTELTIGDNVIVGHGAVIHCRSIGNYVLVGNNATILDSAEIGDFCIVAAGSLVTPKAKMPDKSFVVGMPARIESELSQGKLTQLKKGAEFYAGLTQQYKQQGF